MRQTDPRRHKRFLSPMNQRFGATLLSIIRHLPMFQPDNEINNKTVSSPNQDRTTTPSLSGSHSIVIARSQSRIRSQNYTIPRPNLTIVPLSVICGGHEGKVKRPQVWMRQHWILRRKSHLNVPARKSASGLSRRVRSRTTRTKQPFRLGLEFTNLVQRIHHVLILVC